MSLPAGWGCRGESEPGGDRALLQPLPQMLYQEHRRQEQEGLVAKAWGHEAELARHLEEPACSPAHLPPRIASARTAAVSPGIWAEMLNTKHVSLWLWIKPQLHVTLKYLNFSQLVQDLAVHHWGAPVHKEGSTFALLLGWTGCKRFCFSAGSWGCRRKRKREVRFLMVTGLRECRQWNQPPSVSSSSEPSVFGLSGCPGWLQCARSMTDDLLK